MMWFGLQSLGHYTVLLHQWDNVMINRMCTIVVIVESNAKKPDILKNLFKNIEIC